MEADTYRVTFICLALGVLDPCPQGHWSREVDQHFVDSDVWRKGGGAGVELGDLWKQTVVARAVEGRKGCSSGH
jgi:hypothetical protein